MEVQWKATTQLTVLVYDVYLWRASQYRDER